MGILDSILLCLLACTVYLYIRSKIKHRREILLREHAAKISDAKWQFFTNISHEIQTLVVLILGPLEKLLHTHKDPETQQSYRLIDRNAQRILRLINQLMDMQEIDQGQMKLCARETNVVDFVEDIMKSFECLAQKKNICFNFHHEIDSLNVWIDSHNFDEILFNIFLNAFRFTPDNGEIDVFLSKNNYVFEIKVVDSGIGFKEEDIELIFDRFYQVESEGRLSNYGTGTGLHLTRLLVELHHGTIRAFGRTDRSGAVFVVTAPLGKAHLTPDEIEAKSLQVFPEKTLEEDKNVNSCLKSANEQLMERILRIMNENISNPDLTVEMLSTEVGMSRVHLHRKLKELTNRSSRDFIRNIRLSQAVNLMKDKKLSVSDIAYSVGFSTLSHFSSSFKEFYGMSPKEYMENLN